ncbi:MAG: DUF5685 family protein [Lachnospiraceae bacterium]|nr:DUF5685 family protein [Lachnospiraceae bacterium]
MFGYININRQELSKEQQEQYQSYYCGLCRELKELAGPKGQILLNYDMTFLTILLTGLYEPQVIKERFTCFMHPAKKKTSRSSEASVYAAKMNILLSYQNLQDDWKDSRSISKKTLAMSLKKQYDRISAEYPRQATAIEDYIKKLALTEAGYETNLDAVAGLTGEMLSEIFDWKEDMWSEELRALGFYLGKFVYLMDAYEDIEKDEQMGLYNPFSFWRQQNAGEDFDTFVKLILKSMMAECARSFERMPIVHHADLLRNILYSGVWTRYEMKQLKKRKKMKEKRKSK